MAVLPDRTETRETCPWLVVYMRDLVIGQVTHTVYIGLPTFSFNAFTKHPHSPALKFGTWLPIVLITPLQHLEKVYPLHLPDSLRHPVPPGQHQGEKVWKITRQNILTHINALWSPKCMLLAGLEAIYLQELPRRSH